ncbi:multiple EGF and TSP domain-containing protein [Elysia marginata]|uniref:Multiple EGF and TSP domain-containing protein n=1 Tax=Elysia marginata TaxID=1093978 RepID=A0AAV4ES11_9GAST|nr:multiple EGF and TSP domain-containing protein [Elysia marginata]
MLLISQLIKLDLHAQVDCLMVCWGIVGTWSPWSECSESCKQGFRNRKRRVLFGDAENFDIETISCYATCDDGPCRKDTCTGPAQVCTADGAGSVSCICPMCQGHELSPVCGRIGNVVQTFDTECALQHQACQQRQVDYQLLERRACEDKPSECAAIRKFIDYKDGQGCTADRSVSVGDCYGGCDIEAKQCCTPVDFRSIKVKVTCKDGSSYEKTLQEITSCECRDKKE